MIYVDLIIAEEDIEALGFKYEPDIRKCTNYNTPLKYCAFNVDHGKVTYTLPHYKDPRYLFKDEILPTDNEYVELCASRSPFDYVHSIYVKLPEFKDLAQGMPDVYHGHPTVIICGHTRVKGRYGNWNL